MSFPRFFTENLFILMTIVTDDQCRAKTHWSLWRCSFGDGFICDCFKENVSGKLAHTTKAQSFSTPQKGSPKFDSKLISQGFL